MVISPDSGPCALIDAFARLSCALMVAPTNSTIAFTAALQVSVLDKRKVTLVSFVTGSVVATVHFMTASPPTTS